MPFFSLITVTRNNLSGLKKTLSSIQEQIDQGFEWIVIDGASSDGTPDFLEHQAGKAIGQTPPVFVSEPDDGIYDAMNKGIDRAQGTYCLFLNAGDALADKTVLKRIREAAGAGSFDLLYGDALEERERPDLPPALKPARSHTAIARGLFTHHQAIFYHASALAGRRYDLRYRVAADYDLTARILARGGSALFIPGAICLFERGGLSQKAVRLGRQEQYKSRARQGLVCWPVNLGIYGLQAGASALRAAAPGLYWALRSFDGAGLLRKWRAMVR